MVGLLPFAAASLALAASTSAKSASSSLNYVAPVINPLPAEINDNLGAYSGWHAAGDYPAVPKGCSLDQVRARPSLPVLIAKLTCRFSP